MRKNTSVLDYKKIGYRVRAARREESLSQEVLAERCSTTSRYLSDIENGKCNPSLDMLVRISAALNVSVDSFLYDSPTPFTGNLLKNAIPQKVNQLSNGYWVKDAKSRSSLFPENRIAVILVQKPCRSV